MKEKRLKKGAKEAACSKKEFETIVVQRLSAEVSGKAQKYSRVGAREFVSFEEFGELTIQNIKDACMKHFGINDGKMTCDVLAGEQGPSCTSVKQLPSFKVIHVRFVDEEAVVEIPVSTGEQYLAEPPSKLGKVISKKTTSVQIYAFDMKDMSWSETPIVAEFTIEPQPFGVGGFRKSFKAVSHHKKFEASTWVIKKYLPKVNFDQ